MSETNAADRIIKRVAFLEGDVTKDKMNQLRTACINFSQQSEDPILLVIDSMGGALDPALAFYDFIRLFDINLHTVAAGRCGSSAILPFLSGKKRMMTRHSWLWVHNVRRDIQVFVGDDINHIKRKIEIDLEETMIVTQRVISTIQERTNQTCEVIQKLINEGQEFNAYISPEKSLQLGFVNEIVDSLTSSKQG